MHRIPIAALFLVFTCQAYSYQDCEESGFTEGSSNFASCIVDKEFQEVDKELNAEYKGLISDLKHFQFPIANDLLLPLKKAQLAWVKYRDNHCESLSIAVVGSTTGWTYIHFMNCKIEVTKERIVQLKKMRDAL